QAFVVLASLPMLSSGKIDRKALPEPGSVLSAGVTDGAPGDPVEELLATVWAEGFDLPRVGINADFFALGGHSLLALKIIERTARAGLELTVDQVFQHPTVAALARATRRRDGVHATGDPSLVVLRSTGARPPLFLVHTTP